MGQIIIPTPNIPTVTPNAMTNALGVIGAIAVLLKPILATGTVTLEQVAVAVFVAVACFFIGKQDPKMEAQIVSTIQGVVDSTVAAKLPVVLTQVRPVNALETAIVDAAASQAQPQTGITLGA
jgi:hypothetical protein